MRRLRLLWVIPDFPRRGVSAARERFWALLSRLARRHDIHALVVANPEDIGRESELPPGLAGIRVFRRTLMPADDPLSLLPTDVRWSYAAPAFGAAVSEEIARGGFDLVQFEFLESGAVMPEPRVPTILTVHQIGFAASWPLWRAEGGHIGRIPRVLYRHLRALDFELRALSRAHHVITMSAEDAARLRRFVPGLRTSVSPVGVDCNEFRPAPREASHEVDLLFVGHFHHPPNLDAARFLVRDVMPALGERVRLRIVGHDAPQELGRAAGVEVTGPVDDVRPHLAAARIVVAPVRFGTGMRGKVLEALAMERPVVTTSLGAEGLRARSDTHLLIADGAAAFATAVRRLLSDPDLGVRLARAGRQLVETHFDWDVIAAAHDELYSRVLSDPGARLAFSPTRAAAQPLASRRLGYWPGAIAGAALVGVRGLRWYAGTWRRWSAEAS